eukprot:gnl/TRDRNA2_/TRDRNA2_90948_c0_seq2.p2 gnl/TRDRNA2_/TRDRNA2_90948_c0~~gnl/TRDRNA2_/TRDRNA2_90948_c0_seq2.p2  ORF type:complete len:121 (+),score=12.55 gnl/TRDRNA2_/TRDRNA2_90948_c0_seq2:59-421(+)
MWTQRIAALSGCSAVGAGAVGAHALPFQLQARGLTEKDVATYVKVFETGARYHLIHAGVLLCSSFSRKPALTAALLASGQVLFSGSLYTVAALGSRDNLASKVAPFGGGLLMLGWLSFAL